MNNKTECASRGGMGCTCWTCQRFDRLYVRMMSDINEASRGAPGQYRFSTGPLLRTKIDLTTMTTKGMQSRECHGARPRRDPISFAHLTLIYGTPAQPLPVCLPRTRYLFLSPNFNVCPSRWPKHIMFAHAQFLMFKTPISFIVTIVKNRIVFRGWCVAKFNSLINRFLLGPMLYNDWFQPVPSRKSQISKLIVDFIDFIAGGNQ